MLCHLAVFGFFLQILRINCEIFTAQVELESLHITQQSVVDSVELYLAKEELRLEEIRRRLDGFINRGRQEPSTVVQNPLTAFLLLKGLSVDLDDLISIAELKANALELRSRVDSLKKTHRFPTTEDLSGAAVAITRLQETYQLDTGDLARGDLSGHCCTNQLTAEDCFELGRQNYNSGDYDHTVLWMNEALERSQKEELNRTRRSTNPKSIKSQNQFTLMIHDEMAKSFQTMSTVDILEYLAFSTYQKGEISSAIDLTEQLLNIDPNHPRAKGNIAHYEKLLIDRRGEDGQKSDQSCTIREKRIDKIGSEKFKYEALCRGEHQHEQKGLSCSYANKNNPYLVIGPVKEEMVHREPNVYIYHDVLFDDEIDIIKKLATPRFKRATVHNQATGELVTAQYRISKSAWLQDSHHDLVKKVNKRVAALTGLEVETAEELQVVNYGLGGHYEPHFDFARRTETEAFSSLGTGNRIATFLFYMSEVEAGGATVFPTIDLTLWPEKGAAAFWHNLFDDGLGDTHTRHAACPVILGSKWVSNKWLHERGQEFKRPCGLTSSQKIARADQ